MITLKEILHSIEGEKKEGLINIDDWRWPDLEYLVNMGFEFADDFRLITPREPKITIYKKKDKDEKTGKPEEYFYIKEDERDMKRFFSFSDLIDYFDTYSQPSLDKNK